LCSGGATVVAIPTDVTDETQVSSLFMQAMQRFGRLDILVNSAGAFDGGPIEELTLQTWNQVIGACVTGPFLCTREAFRIMKPARHGRIINIGSISAQRSRENMSPYTTAKFAIDGFTQSAALEGRDFGICVSCLHPGNVMVERRANSGDGEPMMEVATIARAALLMATLPPDVNMLSAIVLPLTQKYIGRG
jgi:NAD(P)-dependent dehydrogenase (short-subunit alcohol dehydrogenase family)